MFIAKLLTLQMTYTSFVLCFLLNLFINQIIELFLINYTSRIIINESSIDIRGCDIQSDPLAKEEQCKTLLQYQILKANLVAEFRGWYLS